ncbi:hypothetical protein RUM44_001939 [Polyplax serrata]|uniref:Uncharacterized protein n=1 Tax=Polyplax serrata TaxID=468196 RepID=A0ABR1AM61_POLSC
MNDYVFFLFSVAVPYSCRAPIASLDCMEEFTGTNEHLTMHAAPTKEALLTGFHNQTSLGIGANPVGRQGSVTPGLRYKNLGKSGLRVSNIGLGKLTEISDMKEKSTPEKCTLCCNKRRERH